MDPAALADALAARHLRDTGGVPDGPRLADYAESSRVGDWSLRSALVRFAQPEPVRASAVLELIRRLDGALAGVRRTAERHPVVTDAELDVETLLAGPDPVAPVLDARTSDLARVQRAAEAGDAVVERYAAAQDLDDEEHAAIPLYVQALALDELAGALAAWAHDRAGPPPVERVDEISAAVFARLGELGVPRERGQGERGRG